jgi:CRISPR-associated protein Cas5t
LEIALGTMPDTNSEVCTLYQQLHSYPVGNSGKDDLKPRTHGAKFWITPVKRELLVGFHMAIGVRGKDDLLEKVKLGLAGGLDEPRYGLPFAGDNNLLFDQIDILTAPPLAKWYVQMDSKGKPMKGSYRLTVGIDRSDNSQTTSLLYAPIEEPTWEPPTEAWTWTPKRPELAMSQK